MRYLNSLCLKNFLSFGPDSGEIALEPLNVIIGSNGSGKSNLIEAIGLLRAAARGELPKLIREGGGIREWLWKGAQKSPMTVETVSDRLMHRLSLAEAGPGFEISEEVIEGRATDGKKPVLYFENRDGKLRIRKGKSLEELDPKALRRQESALDLSGFGDSNPLSDVVGENHGEIRLYRDWRFGPGSPARLYQAADLPNDYLEDDVSNLGLILNQLRRNPGTKKELLHWLGMLGEDVTDVDVAVEGGTVETFLQQGEWTIPAPRLSEGALRWLALLGILLHSEGNQYLACIEDPEIGLHPDLLPSLAELLLQASRKMQLIVTTRSDILVDALTGSPEAVMVCEKEAGVTRLRRLQKKELGLWLDRYRGRIGGSRGGALAKGQP